MTRIEKNEAIKKGIKKLRESKRNRFSIHSGYRIIEGQKND